MVFNAIGGGAPGAEYEYVSTELVDANRSVEYKGAGAIVAIPTSSSFVKCKMINGVYFSDSKNGSGYIATSYYSGAKTIQFEDGIAITPNDKPAMFLYYRKKE